MRSSSFCGSISQCLPCVPKPALLTRTSTCEPEALIASTSIAGPRGSDKSAEITATAAATTASGFAQFGIATFNYGTGTTTVVGASGSTVNSGSTAPRA